MSRRMRDIAQHVARGTETTAAYPSVSGLAALCGDFAALQRELVEEAAHSMGSAARRLEASLAVLERLDEELERLAEDETARRSELVQRFNAERERALLRLHYLRIQREALGFTRHDELEAHYPVPPKKREPSAT